MFYLKLFDVSIGSALLLKWFLGNITDGLIHLRKSNTVHNTFPDWKLFRGLRIDKSWVDVDFLDRCRCRLFFDFFQSPCRCRFRFFE